MSVKPTVILSGSEILKQFDESGAACAVMVTDYSRHELATRTADRLRKELSEAGRDDVRVWLNGCVMIEKIVPKKTGNTE